MLLALRPCIDRQPLKHVNGVRKSAKLFNQYAGRVAAKAPKAITFAYPRRPTSLPLCAEDMLKFDGIILSKLTMVAKKSPHNKSKNVISAFVSCNRLALANGGGEGGAGRAWVPGEARGWPGESQVLVSRPG